MNPAQRPPCGQPLIEVAHQNDNSRALLSQGVEQLFHLESPLHGQKSKMRYDNPHHFAVDFEIGVDGAARFALPITEIQIAHMVNFIACEQHIAVMPIGALHGRARDGIEASGGGQIIHLMQLFDAAGIGVDFLKTDDLSAACFDHLGDARGVAAAIGADALMNIVGQHREALHESGG